MNTISVILTVIYSMVGLKLLVRFIKACINKVPFLSESTCALLVGIVIVHCVAGAGYGIYLVIRGLVHASL